MKYRLKFKKQAQTTADLVKRTLGMGLGGAAIGGGLLGGINREIKPGETEEERRKRLRNAIVIGSLLGGSGGAGLSLAAPTILGPNPPANIRSNIESKLTDRHVTLPAIGAGAGAAIRYKDLPTKGNINTWLRSTDVGAGEGIFKGPDGLEVEGPLAKVFKKIDKAKAWKRPIRRVAFGLQYAAPNYRGLAAIGLGTAAGIILNKLYDRGIIGTGRAVIEH